MAEPLAQYRDDVPIIRDTPTASRAKEKGLKPWDKP